MNPQVSAIDTNALLAGMVQNQSKTSLAGGAFEELLSRFQAAADQQVAAVQPSASITTNQSSSASSATNANQIHSKRYGDSSKPIERFKQSLEDTGQPLSSFQASAEDVPKLKEILVQSGYSTEAAEEVIARARQDDGSVNLGDMFDILEQYQPTEGPVFLLNVEDKILLAQVLKDLGVGEAELQNFLEGLPQIDGKLVVSGLPKLLEQVSAQAEAANSDGFTVDEDILRDLLARLGLDSEEINTLLAKSTDSEGRTDAQAMLEVLNVAADRQETQVTDALRDLAAKLKISPQGEEQASDAARIRAQVVKALQGFETQSVADAAEAKQATPRAPVTEPASGGDSAERQFSQFLSKEGQSEQKSSGDGQQADKETLRLAGEAIAAKAKPAAETPTQSSAGLAAAAADKAATATQTAGTDASTATARVGGESSGATQQTGQASSAKGTLPTYVVRQVGDQMAQMVRRNLNTLRLNLKPPELGGLKLELSVKDGAVKATLVAETAAAKNALDAGADQLKQLLSQQGLKLERLEVFVQAGGEERQAENQQNKGQQAKTSASSGAEAVDAAGEDGEDGLSAQAAGQGSGRINLFA